MAKFCLPQKISKMIFGLFFAFATLGLVISGVTVLPVIGFIVAVPFGLISFYFFRAHLNDQCELES
ncbi:MAG: hypothetical protein U9Q38_06990 [Thermodesulfobacteriota bacterium]|nr:hypothetical protein [Thermodesulfobacteriota bacterium]